MAWRQFGGICASIRFHCRLILNPVANKQESAPLTVVYLRLLIVRHGVQDIVTGSRSCRPPGSPTQLTRRGAASQKLLDACTRNPPVGTVLALSRD